MTDQRVIRWGIIGPGTIAKTFASNIPHASGARLVAIGTRDPKKPGLAEGFPGARILDGYQAVIDDPEVDAIYIGTPHPMHAEWAIKAAAAGKHVLSEKPLAVSTPEAEAMIHAARKAGTFFGEAFMNLLHPHTAKLIEILKAGAIGDIMMIKTDFGFRMGNPNPKHRLLANETAGGGILDICCYPVSMARLIAGIPAGKAFLEPTKVAGVGHLGETGADHWASAVLQFPNGIVAEVSGSVMVAQDNGVRVYGSTGWLEAKSAWFCTGRQGGTAEIVIHRPAGKPDETIVVEERRWLYTFEIEAVGRAIREGRREFEAPAMDWAASLGNMRVLDKWRASIGLEYGFEKPVRGRITVGGSKLKKPGKPMPRRDLPGVPVKTSVLALGSANFETYRQAQILFDAFYERGGNLLDSAWLYGGGRADRLVGDWMKARGVRKEMVVIGKGAHAPLTYPDVIARQLTESLDRLKTDRIDIYFMHRDNPIVPVGEFVDAMDAEVRAGRIGIYGGSNWTRERMEAAFAYAKKKRRHPPSALSNNFSLAEMIDPPWAGCLSARDEAWKKWLKKRGIANFAWSSQAQGFFTDRAGRDKTGDKNMVRCWYNKTNFARRDRAAELGKKLGRSATQVAVAWTLAQKNPVVPLIGPLTLQELEDSLGAAEITLTPAELNWLEG